MEQCDSDRTSKTVVRDENLLDSQRLMQCADVLFQRVEKNDGTAGAPYHECIAMYERVLSEQRPSPADITTLKCNLNISVCFARLNEWGRALHRCRIAIAHCCNPGNASISWMDELRARYISISAMLHLSQSIQEEELDLFRSMVMLHRSELSAEDLSEYDSVILRAGKRIQTGSEKKGTRPTLESCLKHAVELQQNGEATQAAEELCECADLLLRTSKEYSEGRTACRSLYMQAAFINESVREFARAIHCCDKALFSTDTSDAAGLAVIKYVRAVCCCQAETGSALLSMQDAVSSLEECVFEALSGTPRDRSPNRVVSDLLAVLALSAQRHVIEHALALSSRYVVEEHITAWLALVTHLLCAYDVLVDGLGKAGKYRECDEVNDRAIDACNALLASAQLTAASGSGGADSADVTALRAHVLKQRARSFCTKALLYKEHGLLCDPAAHNELQFSWRCSIPGLPKRSKVSLGRISESDQHHTYHRLRFESAAEAVAVLLQVAAQEYEEIDLPECIRTYAVLASYTMRLCDIEPFRLDPLVSSGRAGAVDRKDLAERAMDAWRKVAVLAMRKRSLIDAVIDGTPADDTIALKGLHFEKYNFLQQAMLAYYHAGVCGFHCAGIAEESVAVLAQRSLESAESVRSEIDALLAVPVMAAEFALHRNQTKNAHAESESLHGYYDACGDLAYHLAQAYQRAGAFRDMLRAAVAAAQYYQHADRLLFALNAPSAVAEKLDELHIPLSEMTAQSRLRQRQAAAAVVVAHCAMGDDKRAAAGLRRVADLCLGPIEDADREVAAVRSLVDQQRRAVEQEMRDDAARAAAELAAKAAPRTVQSKPDAVSARKPVTPSADSGVSNMRWEAVAPNEKPSSGFDYNMLVAYFVLGSFAAMLVAAWLSYR